MNAHAPKQNMMKHADFSIGKIFRCGDKRWRCTDVGARVIVAICLDHDDDPSWYNGPPYAVVESVFDEYDIEGCAPDADEEATKTNTGETETTTDAAADDLVEFWRQAEPTAITVSPEAYDEFVNLLNAPPRPNARLRELMKRKPTWEKDGGGKGDG